MPAVVSHYLLAERVFNSLAEYYPHLNLNHTAFLWGSYGPDIFFSHRILPWQKEKSLSYISSKMHHTDADKILNYLMSCARNTESDIAESYALGFVTHYTFDCTAHPFVVYFAEVMAKNNPSMHTSICHNDIEANLDTIFLKYETSKKITSFKLGKTSPIDKNVSEIIADMLHSYCISYGLGNIPCKDIIQVQKDWHNSLVLLNDKTTLKKPVVRLGEKILHLSPMLSPIIRTPHPDLSFDYANMNHSEWHKQTNPEESHSENFFELADIAEQLSLRLIANLLSGRNLTHEQCTDTFSGTAQTK